MIDQPEYQTISTDIAVVGGGLAGVCAAIAAAREGSSVALVQERPVFGGNSSSEIRVHPVGASQHGKLRDARETGIMEELFLDVRSRSYGLRQINGQHYPMWDVVLAEKVDAEPNIQMFLNTRVINVETSDSDVDGYETRVVALTAVQQGSEGVFRFEPSVVIDATGYGSDSSSGNECAQVGGTNGTSLPTSRAATIMVDPSTISSGVSGAQLSPNSSFDSRP